MGCDGHFNLWLNDLPTPTKEGGTKEGGTKEGGTKPYDSPLFTILSTRSTFDPCTTFVSQTPPFMDFHRLTWDRRSTQTLMLYKVRFR
jgi:hypothetical protein